MDSNFCLLKDKLPKTVSSMANRQEIIRQQHKLGRESTCRVHERGDRPTRLEPAHGITPNGSNEREENVSQYRRRKVGSGGAERHQMGSVLAL